MKSKIMPLVPMLLLALLVQGCGDEKVVPEPRIPLVKAIQVRSAANATGQSYPGKAAAAREANLSFRISGPLIEFPVKVGDETGKGDLLARIDPHDFEVQLNNAQGQLDRALAAMKLAEMEYERVKRIHQRDSGAVSQSMLDQNREAYNQAKAQLGSLQASVTAARDALGYTMLRAPFTGTVVATFAENYEDVQAKKPVVRLLDISNIEFKVDIPESTIGLIPWEEKARVRFDVYPARELNARIKEIGREASRTTRTYPITLIMEQPGDFMIHPGMAGRARFENHFGNDTASGSVEIPLSAIFKGSAGTDCIWVIDGKTQTVTLRKVRIGALTQDGVTVPEGLKPGEWVVAAGVHSLSEGEPVRILSPEKADLNREDVP